MSQPFQFGFHDMEMLKNDKDAVNKDDNVKTKVKEDAESLQLLVLIKVSCLSLLQRQLLFMVISFMMNCSILTNGGRHHDDKANKHRNCVPYPAKYK